MVRDLIPNPKGMFLEGCDAREKCSLVESCFQVLSVFLLLNSAGRSSQRKIETEREDRRGADEERDGRCALVIKGLNLFKCL